MKTFNKFFLGVGLVAGLASCSDFDDVNIDPTKTPIESTQPEFFLNNAIGKIQMDPSTGERMYYLTGGMLPVLSVKRDCFLLEHIMMTMLRAFIILV